MKETIREGLQLVPAEIQNFSCSYAGVNPIAPEICASASRCREGVDKEVIEKIRE